MELEERLRRKNGFDGELVMGASRFNTATGRDIHLRQRSGNGKKSGLIDSSTGLLKEELGIYRSCPVCGNNGGRPIFIKDGFRHLRCDTCDMVYVSPALNKERLRSFYEDEDSYTQVLLNEVNLDMDRKRFQYGLDLIEEYCPGRGDLLDVGCGPGTFLQVARERGWQVEGVEFNRWCVQHLLEEGISVIDVPLEDAELPPETYECVTLWAVLEHIIDPGSFLRSIHRILVPDGLLLVQVPNIDSLANRILHERSATFAGDSHVNLFNVQTLGWLLQREAFEIVEAETILSLLGTINNYLNYEDPQFGEGVPVLDFLTPELIHEKMMGYSLLALARACE